RGPSPRNSLATASSPGSRAAASTARAPSDTAPCSPTPAAPRTSNGSTTSRAARSSGRSPPWCSPTGPPTCSPAARCPARTCSSCTTWRPRGATGSPPSSTSTAQPASRPSTSGRNPWWRGCCAASNAAPGSPSSSTPASTRPAGPWSTTRATPWSASAPPPSTCWRSAPTPCAGGGPTHDLVRRRDPHPGAGHPRRLPRRAGRRDRPAPRTAGGFHPRLWLGGEEELLAADLAADGWWLTYADHLAIHHQASVARDPTLRRRHGIRNTLWFTWLRRPPRTALRRTLALARSVPRDTTSLRAFAEATAALPWVLRERRVLPHEVESRLRPPAPAQRTSTARRYTG